MILCFPLRRFVGGFISRKMNIILKKLPPGSFLLSGFFIKLFLILLTEIHHAAHRVLELDLVFENLLLISE